jgi:hypothetical protein
MESKELKLNPILFNPVTDLDEQYKFVKFIELGLEMVFLSPKNHRLNQSRQYMFGMFKNEVFYWFFGGATITANRDEMREIYKKIIEQTKNENQVVFAFRGNAFK